MYHTVSKIDVPWYKSSGLRCLYLDMPMNEERLYLLFVFDALPLSNQNSESTFQ